MSVLKIVAIVLIVGGVLGLVYGKFTYPQDKHEAKMGPIEISIKDNKTVNIPIWVGFSAIAVGGVLLFVGNKKN